MRQEYSLVASIVFCLQSFSCIGLCLILNSFLFGQFEMYYHLVTQFELDLIDLVECFDVFPFEEFDYLYLYPCYRILLPSLKVKP